MLAIWKWSINFLEKKTCSNLQLTSFRSLRKCDSICSQFILAESMPRKRYGLLLFQKKENKLFSLISEKIYLYRSKNNQLNDLVFGRKITSFLTIHFKYFLLSQFLSFDSLVLQPVQITSHFRVRRKSVTNKKEKFHKLTTNPLMAITHIVYALQLLTLARQ